MGLKYKRVLLKLSGEGLLGEGKIIDHKKVSDLADVIKKCIEAGLEMAIVIGGGNIWRGAKHGEVERVTADYMGMLATVINAMAFGDALAKIGLEHRLTTAFSIKSIGEPYYVKKVQRHLEKGRVVLLSGGTGLPYFSTDTGAALRAAEINADIILKATNVDGVYTADPDVDKNATKFDKIALNDILKGKLRVMDLTAATFSDDNKIKMLVFNVSDPENIWRAVNGEGIGTLVE